MRLLIDMQGAQSSGSRRRGIGRYSLAISRELCRMAGGRTDLSVSLLLNSAFPDAVAELRQTFRGLVDPAAIHVWVPPPHVTELEAPLAMLDAAAMVRSAAIAAIAPDAVLVTSLFEGLGDPAVITVNDTPGPITAVVLYDLIPLIQDRRYLANPDVARFYYRRLKQMRRADLWLAISESARLEGIDHLQLPPDDVVAISTAGDDTFRPVQYGPAEVARLRTRYGLAARFVMYTGGIDYRKNIEGLIRAFALLPPGTRAGTTLAIVCAADTRQREALLAIGQEHGLGDEDLRITGFVPEDDLVALYNLCDLFVFPSIHEGFGLPALEALQCGAPVIGSDTSSIPEVIGDADALFDPTDDDAIAARMAEYLDDPVRLQALRDRAAAQAARFSWANSAKRTLEALRRKLAGRSLPAPGRPARRPSLALVSPMPPHHSGIAQYAAELAAELSAFYDITFVVDGEAGPVMQWNGFGPVLSPDAFGAVAHTFDRIVYQMGNSSFHGAMPELMQRFPGIVVLHDHALGGLACWKDVAGGTPGYWLSRLRDQHGIAASIERLQLRTGPQTEQLQRRYACNIDAVRFSKGIVVHSEHVRDALVREYGSLVSGRLTVIPLLRTPRPPRNRVAVRKALGYGPNDFVVCTFGGIAPQKMHDVLLQAWFASGLAADAACTLVLVGGIDEDTPFARKLRRVIAGSAGGERVRITGYTPDDTYADFLAAADLGVQLRERSNGETSAALMDCLGAGLPLVLNAHGSFAEVPHHLVRRLAEHVAAGDLAAAMEQLRANPAEARQLGTAARDWLATVANPAAAAGRYRTVIEAAPVGTVAVREALLHDMARLLPAPFLRDNADAIAASVLRTLPVPVAHPRLLIDVTDIDNDMPSAVGDEVDDLVAGLLASPILHRDALPAVAGPHGPALAWSYAQNLLDETTEVPDERLLVVPGDAALGVLAASGDEPGQAELWHSFRAAGVPTLVLFTDAMLAAAMADRSSVTNLVDRLGSVADAVLVQSAAAVPVLQDMLDEVAGERSDPLWILQPAERQARPLPAEIEAAFAFIGAGQADGLQGHAVAFPRDRLVVRAASSRLGTSNGTMNAGLLRTTGTAGYMVFGDYQVFEPGHYEVQCHAQVDLPGGAVFEFSAANGQTVLASLPFERHEGLGTPALVLQVAIPERTAGCEIRVLVTSETALGFEKYAVTRLDGIPSTLPHPRRRERTSPAARPPEPGPS